VELALQEPSQVGDRTTAGSVEHAPSAFGSRPGPSPAWLVAAACLAGALAVALGAAAVAELVRSDGPPLSAASTPSGGARQAIEVLAKPGAERVPFAGAEGRLTLVAGPLGRSALVLDGLPPAPAGRSYQAWHDVGGESASLAVFRGTEVAVQLRGLLPPGATVVVTLEREGGSDVPSGRRLYTAGRGL
jgi:hypothetical protein